MLKSSITIIVPFLPGEEGYLSSLFYDLRNCPFSFELILSSPQSFKSFHLGMNEELTHSLNKILEKAGNQFQYVQAGPGRAVQMNAAAKLSSNGNYLWFVHVDSRISEKNWQELHDLLQKDSSSKTAWYFPLGFSSHGNRFKLISFWANIRCKLLGMIYGDQALLIPRKSFFRLGSFLEDLTYGEDHDFVWRFVLAGGKWKSFSEAICTAGRAYGRNWLKLCFKRIYLGFKQALPFMGQFLLKGAETIDFEEILSVGESDLADSNQAKTAVVVFVKTPGLSSLKTRLAKDLGKMKAESFHVLSCKKIEATLLQAQIKLGVSPYWAVAEEQALEHSLWSGFPVKLQSSGGLGERLHHMYAHLKQEFEQVIFLGADTPQLSVQDLEEALAALQKGCDFHLGYASDGGYYLFAGKSPLDKSLWTSIPYSVSETGQRFAKALKEQGRLSEAKKVYSDVDTVKEYSEVVDQMYRF